LGLEFHSPVDPVFADFRRSATLPRLANRRRRPGCIRVAFVTAALEDIRVRGGRESAMSLAPLRLLHVADAALDRPLEQTGPLPDDGQETVEDATLTAFRRAVDAAVAQGVHAVLLTGETFRERDASLRARIALLDGLRTLADHDIPAFVVPGRRCPASAWQAIPDLPENVTLCEAPGDPQSAANAWPIRHDDRLVGTLLVGDASQLARRDTTPHANGHTNGHAGATGNGHVPPAPARVGVLTVCEPVAEPAAEPTLVEAVEFTGRPSWAVGGHATPHFPENDRPATGRFDVLTVAGRESLPAGIVREPGPKETVPTACGTAAVPARPQPLAPAERDASGVVLIEVFAGGLARSTVATAPVRYHAVEIDVQPDTPRAGFVSAMAAALSFPPMRPGESLRLVEWTIRGGGPLMDDLHDPDGRQLLIDEATLEAEPPAEPRLEHRFRLITDPAGTTPDTPADETAADTLAATFRAVLANRAPLEAELPGRLSAHLAAVPADQQVPGASGRLLDLIAELDPAAVLAAAEHTGRAWLSDGKD
jgi:hypothetical protein